MIKMKWLLIITVLMTMAAFNSPLQAQVDEILELDSTEQTEQNNCVPENLNTPYDKFAETEFETSVPMLYNFGTEHFKNKNYKEALPYLWKVFLHDEGKRARLSISKIAQIYFEEQKVDSVLISCFRGLERFPELILLHYYAGYIQDKLGKFRCAIPHYEKLVESDSTNKAYLKTIAFLYYKDEDERAIEMQERLVALDPANSEEANSLAQYNVYFHGAGAGLDAYKQAYENDPENVDVALSYGKSALESGKYNESLEPLSKAIAKNPGTKALTLRASAYENLSRFNDAISDYKKVLENEPNNADVMLNISLNYRSLNSYSNANYWISKALSAKPGYGFAYIIRGELYEAAVSYCQGQRGGKVKYEDKLVYEKANSEYDKAKNDPIFRSKATVKQNNLKPFLPTTEDKFMHKNDKIKDDCFSWIAN
ncbi:MAG: tetratricopeptide repeat protein [Calditrichaceae bacterium]